MHFISLDNKIIMQINHFISKKNNFFFILLLILLRMLTVVPATAQNPIIQTIYTADPAPMVWNDRLYLYTTHDADASTWFTMDDWRAYSTNDMVNWTDHGMILSYTDFEWAKGDAWAAQCIERNGKFYLYVPMISRENNRGAIGVAVADTPTGPFYDPLGKPLAQTDWGDIDPTVFIDDDGQAYLYWGNPNLYYVKLNEDMISFEGDIVKVPLTEESFGKREGDPQRSTRYEEGPWLYKRNQLYYLFWPGGPLPEHIGYSTSQSPKDLAVRWRSDARTGKGIHQPSGVIDFRGRSYFFYHNGALRVVVASPAPWRWRKSGSTLMEPFAAADDRRHPTGIGDPESLSVEPGRNHRLLRRIQVVAKRPGRGICDGQQGWQLHKVRDVDFRNKGARKFTARVGTTHNAPVTLEVRLGSLKGEQIASMRIPRTGGSDRWALVTADIPNVTGLHDLYFVVRGNPKSHLMYFDYWKFAE